jgi:hypothetical protein
VSKNWMMLTGLLLLGPVGTSQAQPLDSPDPVYIDGLPCNSLCQSYMAWSWQHASTMVAQPASAQPTRRSSDSEVRRATATRRESSTPAAHDRTARPAMPSPAARTAELHPADNAAVVSKLAPANVAASLPTGGAAATSNTRTVQEQVAIAKALAERLTFVTAAPAPEQEASNLVASGFTAAEASDTKSAESAPTNNTGNLVAVLIARPEIKSLSDLAGKDVAIEGRRSASNASIRTAIAAAGAAEVQLNEGHTKALDRVIGGEVPAAVLALVSPEAAEWFPDIPRFRIFRVPLAPRY